MPIEGLQAFAVKEAKGSDEAMVAACEREFNIINRTNHPNVIKGYEMFKDEYKKSLFQVITLVKGIELEE